MQKIAIIVAGGKGLRMGNDLPKQFMPIGGIPVLMHTLKAFELADPTIKITLVLPESQQSYWMQICNEYNFTTPHSIANGGESRFHSVKNGLLSATSSLTETATIGIHDGVRPFVSPKVITESYQAAAVIGSAIPVIEVHESVRRLTDSQLSTSVDRSQYRLVQTPQVFTSDILLEAYKQPYSELFTDDASVVEASGHNIHLTNGNRENIKITTPFDILIAEALLAQK